MNAEYRKIENAGPAGLLSQRFYTPGALTVTFLPQMICRKLHRSEAEFRGMRPNLSGIRYAVREVRVIRSIREELRFKAECPTLGIWSAILACRAAIQVVSGIELDPGKRCQNLHGNPGGRG